VKDDSGAVVQSKLEGDTLRAMAEESGGAYRDASFWVDLPALLKSTVEEGRKGGFVERNTARHIERYQWVLAPALLCLLMSFWKEFPVQPKPRAMRLAPPAAVKKAAMLRLAFCLLSVASGIPAIAFRQQRRLRRPAPCSGGSSEVVRAGCARRARLVGIRRQTVEWGRQIQSQRQAVPPGPVRDALAAVDAGSAMDPKATDWPALRSQLEDLLKKPEDQQKKQEQQQQKQQQDKKQNPSNASQQQQQQQPEEQNQSGSPKDGNPKQSQSPFEDMKPPSPPPQGKPRRSAARRQGGAPIRRTRTRTGRPVGEARRGPQPRLAGRAVPIDRKQ